jgi:site-specific DNA-methyltransferase (adenine-specific)
VSIELLNVDCMDYMAGLEDNAFDLAIVDPPYGIERFKKGSLRFDSSEKSKDGLKWDVKPEPEYFIELARVSIHQIIWGANNFNLPATEYFCIWDKCQTVDNFATAEYAYVSQSLKKPAKIFKYSIHQHNSDHAGGTKIHPTQKPVKLYEWLLANYAKEGDKILDTHLGSGSSAIAAHYGGFDFVGCELDEDYYNAAMKRFDNETRQIDLLGEL